MEDQFPVNDSPVTIATAQDMASFLRSCSSENAAAFARAAHERACWGYDAGRVVFWEQVVEALVHNAALTKVAA